MPNPAPFAWTPSTRRTIALWNVVATAPEGRLPAILPLRWPDKLAAAAQDYSIDATVLLAGGDSGLTVAVNNPGSLTVVAIAVTGGVASLWLAGGEPGADAVVDLTLATAGGRAVRRFVRMAVT